MSLPDDRASAATAPDRRFADDADAHRRDQPRHCPACAASLDLASEFWEGDERRFYCWCAGCGWTGEITTTAGTARGHEPEHDRG